MGRGWGRRWLPAAAMSALLTALVAVAPLYARAMSQALTDVELDRATAAELGLRVDAVPYQVRFARPGRVARPEEVPALVPATQRAAYGAPVLSYLGTAFAEQGLHRTAGGPIMWRQDQCRHVTVLLGRCPRAGGRVAMSPVDARADHLAPGCRIVVSAAPGPAGAAPAGGRRREPAAGPGVLGLGVVTDLAARRRVAVRGR